MFTWMADLWSVVSDDFINDLFNSFVQRIKNVYMSNNGLQIRKLIDMKTY